MEKEKEYKKTNLCFDGVDALTNKVKMIEALYIARFRLTMDDLNALYNFTDKQYQHFQNYFKH